jgi:drug/metabolite transporter superfamily protein YnfA
VSTSPRPSVRERCSAWMSEIDAYYFGIRGWGLLMVLGGAIGIGWSLDDVAVNYEGPGRFVTIGSRLVMLTNATTHGLVTNGTLALPLACSATALLLLLISRRPFGRVLAAFCGVGAFAAVSMFALRTDAEILGGLILFWTATGAIALGACLCNVTPRVLARRGRPDDSFPA